MYQYFFSVCKLMLNKFHVILCVGTWAVSAHQRGFSDVSTHSYADFSQDLLWNSASVFENLIQRASVLLTATQLSNTISAE